MIESFYYNSKIEWPYQFTDKRLAIGFIKLGSLIEVDGKLIDRQNVVNIVHQCDRIVEWKILSKY